MAGMMLRLLDARLRKVRRRAELPDTPEVRALMRASWLDGFTFGAVGKRRLAELRRRAFESVVGYADD